MTLAPANSHANGYPLGLTGAVSPTRYVGGTADLAPTTGTWAVGDFVISATGKVWVCTVAGTPGTWTQAGGTGAGTEIGYDQITASVNVASTTEASGTAIISAAAHTFDGSPVICEFFSPFVYTPSTTNGTVTICLFEGATQIGRIGTLENGTIGGQAGGPTICRLRFTPSAAIHTYTVTAFANITTGTPAITAGAGGTGVATPAYLRFTKV